MSDLGGMEGFREESQEPILVSLRVQIQVRETSVWVGVFRLDGSPHAGGTKVWQARYTRPVGKSLGECVEACYTAAWLAQQRGEGVS